MSYNPFVWGEQINPDKVNEKMRQVYELVSLAHTHNAILQERIDMMNRVIANLSEIVPDPSAYVVPATHTFYNQPINGSGYTEAFIGGDNFGDTAAWFARDNSSTLVSDGMNLVLDTSGTVYSRIPLALNNFSERVPSVGTEFSSSDFEEDKLWHILSPDSVWSEVLTSATGTLLITLPETLSPYCNMIKITPVPGTTVKVSHGTGGTTLYPLSVIPVAGTHFYYIDKNIFNGTLQLELTGQDMGGGNYSFGLSHINASYSTFDDTGFLKFTLFDDTLTTAVITNVLTVIDDLDYVNIRISTVDYPDEVGAVIVYDSNIDGINQVIANSFSAGPLYVQIDMTKKAGTTPTLPYLKIRYTS